MARCFAVAMSQAPGLSGTPASLGFEGAAGVDYLDQTALKYRVFHELWAVRTILVRAQDLPPLENPELYGFAGGS